MTSSPLPSPPAHAHAHLTVPPLIITLTGPAPKITKKHNPMNRSVESVNSKLMTSTGSSSSSTSFSSTGSSSQLTSGVPDVPDLGLVIRRQISGLVPNLHSAVDRDADFLRGLNSELTAERERQNALMNLLAEYDKAAKSDDNNNKNKTDD